MLDDTGRRLLVQPSGTEGSLGNASLDEHARTSARERLNAFVPLSGSDWIDDAELFFEVSVPPPDLVVFGAGSDVEPLARFAWDLGFAVTLVDAREAFVTEARFPHATRVLSHFSRFPETVRLTDRTSVVIMNHHLERDRESLRFALGSAAPYIGVLGPRSRFDKLTRALAADGFALDDGHRSRLRSPVGLALGAETPEEIALSILGEILARQRGFDGGFLAGSSESLHRPRSNSAFARS
jgi:xanthine/CO dehydrogenase XdhC/CoxF family maturation factor